MLRTNQSFLAYAEDLYDRQERKEDIVIKKYAKGQRLLSQNETATKVMFIKDGIAKCFFTDRKSVV